ncbi:hypothetical protein ALC60_03318 [Trachymyrmex zeteki]|nr:hypothetical protein ALC60_03318 [Trachymyrmex zeteki]
MSSSSDSSGNSARERSPILSSVPAAQAVNLLASQLPNYSGQEDEDIELWIDKIERVSRIHGVTDEVILLAACNKLNKIAKDWLDLNSGTVNNLWLNFKQAISQRFRREVPYQVIFQKVDNRKWNFSKESFQEYAMHKLKLMQNLRLSDKESINFLISGIGNASLRGMASLIQVENLNQFLDRMHSLTLAYGDPSNKSLSFVNKSTMDKTKLKSETVESGKDGLSIEPTKDVYCVYCRTRGHTRDDCFLLKKEQYKSSSVSSSQLASIATVQEVAPQSTQSPLSSPPLSPTKSSQSSQSPQSSLVACVDTESTLSIGDNLIKVTALNNVSCSLDALLDTGSAVSFLLLKSSPSNLLLGYDQRNNIDSDLIKCLNKIAGIEKDSSLEREKSKELALNVADKIKAYNKTIYDKRHRKPSVYKPDDQRFNCKNLNKNRYVVQDIPGYSLTCRSYNSILSPDSMILWIKALPITLAVNSE